MINHTEKSFALNLAKQAGEIMKHNFTIGMQKEWKEDDSPVTVTDKKINQLVIDAVKKHYPTHSILSEEGSFMIEKSEYTWVCDPIDGTIPFSHGFPIFAFSLALTKNGESILGVTYDPILDRLFYAEKGKGAFLNDSRIEVARKSVLKNSLIDVVWWNGAPFTLPSLTNALEKESALIMKLKSVVYDAMLISCGEAVGAIFANNTPWDIAAIKVIVEEAGGKVTDLKGNEQRYDKKINGAVISNGLLHQDLVALVTQSLQEK